MVGGLSISSLEKEDEMRQTAQVAPLAPGTDAYQPGYKHKIHVRLDDELHKRLKTYTVEHSVTVQSFLENLIRQALA